MKVLVVDDDKSVRESVSKALKGEGYYVLTAADGQEALDHHDPREIELLLLDLGLPIRDGWEIFERITRENPTLPVIVISGNAEKYDVAVAAGAGAFMEKPLDVSKLLETMQDLLEESEEERLRRMTGYRNDAPFVPSRSGLFLEQLRKHFSTPSHFRIHYAR